MHRRTWPSNVRFTAYAIEDIRRENARLRTKFERLVRLSEKLSERIAQLEKKTPK